MRSLARLLAEHCHVSGARHERARPRARRPALLLVVSRRRRFTRHVLDRPDIDTVLLRPEASTVEVPDGRPAFRLRAGSWRRRRPHAFGGGSPTWACPVRRSSATPTRRRSPRRTGSRPPPGFRTSPRQVRLVTDKLAMKELFAAAGLSAARFRAVTSATEVKEFADRYGWPVIVKPAVSGSAVDTWKVDTDRLAAVDLALRSRPDRRWIAEEYIRGTEHQLCALVYEERCRTPTSRSIRSPAGRSGRGDQR
ncbi:acetyl-CoA carboxylase biotin carboxylase subunit family protein [Streptomyces nogalater]